jgi:hypothetical protein
MSRDGFLARLRKGRAVNCIYRSGELDGLVCAWLHAGVFVLTWEECRIGDQSNEHLYTRDELHRFATADEVPAAPSWPGSAA